MQTYTRYFRLNSPSQHFDLIEQLLSFEGFEFAAADFFSPARQLLRSPKPLGDSLAARFGLIYIQDRSAMLPALSLNPSPSSLVLDMCASPGGKTSQLSWQMDGLGLIVANESNSKRISTLQANILLLNCLNVVTANYAGEDLPLAPDSFDHILLDPPCSGWGTILKQSGPAHVWSPQRSLPLTGLQDQLLDKAASLLKPGGQLVYSTCTTNTAENQEQILRFMERSNFELCTLDLPEQVLVQTNAHLKRCMLNLEVDSELGQGFFIAKLRKPGLTEQSKQPAPTPTPSGFALQPEGGKLYARPNACALLPDKLAVSGIQIGKINSANKTTYYPKFRMPLGEAQLEIVNLSKLGLLQRLLAGQSLHVTDFDLVNGDLNQNGQVLLKWRDLPLGRATLKQNRVIWAR